MSINTPEIAAVYGAIDSDAYADGDLPSAHICREMIRGANRLLCRGERIVNMVWDVSQALHSEDMPAGGYGGYAAPFWTKIGPSPLTRPKPGGLTLAKLHLRISTRNTEEIFIQVESLASEFRKQVDAPNILRVSGNGSWQWHTLSNIPISPGSWDELGFYLLGTPVSGTYSGGGTPASQTGGFSVSRTLVEVGGASFTQSPSATAWDRLGSCFTVENAGGDWVVEPKVIVGVSTATILDVLPAFTDSEINRINGNSAADLTYRIRQLPSWRLANLALYAQDRTG